MKKLFQLTTAALIALGAFSSSVSAQEYPNKPIKFVVPFAPGGSTDIVARLIGEKLSERLRQPVVIDNRSGSGGNIGADAVAKAPADGYTMLMGTTGIMAINDSLYATLPYDAAKDLAPVVYIASLTNVLAVNPEVPAKNVQELIEYAKKNPGKLNFASSGPGSATHLVGELFKSDTGVDIVHIPYRGSGQAMTDLLSGQVSMMFDQIASSVSNIEGGKLKALGVTSKDRSAALPDVPTIAESGVPSFEALSWSGIAVPAGTPKPIIDRINREVNTILQDPAIRKRFAELGADPIGGSPADFASHLDEERAKWSKVVKDAKIRIE